MEGILKLKYRQMRAPEQQAELWRDFWSGRGYVLRGGPDPHAFEAFDAIKSTLKNPGYYVPVVIPKSRALQRRGSPANCTDLRNIHILQQMLGIDEVLNELTCKDTWLLETPEDAYVPFFEAEDQQEGDFVTFWGQFGTVFPRVESFHAPLHAYEHDVPIGIAAQAVGSQKYIGTIWPPGLHWWLGCIATKALTAYGVPCFACLWYWHEEGVRGVLSAIPYKEIADVVRYEPQGGRMTAIIPPV